MKTPVNSVMFKQNLEKINYPEIEERILKFWEENNIFQKSVTSRDENKLFTFYEGPPTANGKPGIHHVMARTLKDLVCRYKTLQGYRVERKAGWDTHGLPVEIEVEKKLGIKQKSEVAEYGVEKYNQACRDSVFVYLDLWEKMTHRMGYWINLEDAYITLKNEYIESVWWALKTLFDKGLIYKGYKVVPQDPKAETVLSSHELALGYRETKDPSVYVLFKLKNADEYFLVWTTTPWTLISNVALAVGADVDYVKILHKEKKIILAKATLSVLDGEYEILDEFKGITLLKKDYEQLLQYVTPDKKAFYVTTADFVSTEDGSGIVHIAPAFGQDDYDLSLKYDLPMLQPVTRGGLFTDAITDFKGQFVKDADAGIIAKLRAEGKLYKKETITHSYPFSWRHENVPVIYYARESWFIRTTAFRDRMIELNNTINWKPPSTGSGRFGKWLENLVDWNLSRSRYWGTPLPIWITEDKKEEKCIGSATELKSEIEKSIKAGFMKKNPLAEFSEGDNSPENYEHFDLHRPFVDDIFLVSDTGKKMIRETDLIDGWFDSGAMPYAQVHYPFENKANFSEMFPADYVAEGVDQTRGWFFTLHAIATMISDSVAFKNIISNGLVLDKNGNKMSKRLGNAVDAFSAIEEYGSDPLRWYMLTNSQPWDNLKFDITGVDEVKRKFFGTLFNTYSFFSLYANVDNFRYAEKEIPVNERPEIDRWIISLLNSLVKEVGNCYNDYDLTRAGRAIQDFVTENLSNWYVRLNRKRYWGGEYDKDKLSAYQTLYLCLETVSQLAAPIAPFYMDRLFSDLNNVTGRHKENSVHLVLFPEYNESLIDKTLEERMDIAQKVSSMILGLRRKVSIKVRQPLARIMVPVPDKYFREKFEAVKDLILAEVNVKEVEYIDDTASILVKKIKPNFKTLGPRYGKLMKDISNSIASLTPQEIVAFENNGNHSVTINGQQIVLTTDDVEIISEDIPGWQVANDGKLTVALDITVSDDLRYEGIAREFVNRIQNIRKEIGLDVTDKITVLIEDHEFVREAVKRHASYIASQTLATAVNLTHSFPGNNVRDVEIDEIVVKVVVRKNR